MNNINELLKEVLSNPEIINLTGDKKVYRINALNPTPPYITYRGIDESGEDWAENKEIATTYYVQVDIFSKTKDYDELENKIKDKMINAGFNRYMAADLYEDDTKLYHRPMRFSISLETNKL